MLFQNNKLLCLFAADFKVMRFWLSKNRFSKIIVIFGFLTVFFAMDIGIYFGSISIYSLFQNSEIYGKLTGFYMIHSAVIVLLWFATCSTIIAALNLFLRNNSTLSYLMTLPIYPQTFILWLMSKMYLIQYILIGIFIFPVVFAYSHIFANGISFMFILTTIIVIGIIAAITVGLGIFTGYFILKLTKSSLKKSLLYSGILFLLSGFLVFKLVYPADIAKFKGSQDLNEFVNIFRSLPLGNQNFPTYWLTDSFINGVDVNILFLVILAILFILIVVHIISLSYIPLYRQIQEQRVWRETKMKSNIQMHNLLTLNFEHSRYPILLKDWLSIRRFPSEIGYAVFLFCLACIFLLLLFMLSGSITNSPDLQNRIIIFFFCSLMFFVNAFLLRFCFPLMAKEGNSSWYIFTQPISTKIIMKEKLFLSLLLLLPFFVLIPFIWFNIKFSYPYQFIIIFLSILTIFTLGVVANLMGAIFPNFSEAKDPEKISTSGTGLFSLAISICLVGIDAFILLQIIKNVQMIPLLIALSIMIKLLILFIIFVIYQRNKQYQF